MRVRVLHLLLLVVAVAGCATGLGTSPAPRPEKPAAATSAPAPELPATGLAFQVEPASAEILVDGESRGTVAALQSGALGLPSGIYQVSLRAPGFVTWRAEVAVRSARERIEVTLARKEPAAP